MATFTIELECTVARYSDGASIDDVMVIVGTDREFQPAQRVDFLDGLDQQARAIVERNIWKHFGDYAREALEEAGE